MNEEIKSLCDAMHDAATESFYAAERFGKGSAEHLNLQRSFAEAAGRYETACKAAGIEAYATYSED